MNACRSVVILLGVGVLVGCAEHAARTDARHLAATPVKTPATNPEFEARVREAIAGYKGWTRVSNYAHWAPTDCRAPIVDGIQVSASRDGSSHGQKLYYLFAKEHSDYLMGGAATGQALVKESWVPKVVDESKLDEAIDRTSHDPATNRPNGLDPRSAIVGLDRVLSATDGKTYAPGAPGPLFVMVRLEPDAPGTDRGWVYATATPDGQTITSIGRVRSCMNCHIKTSDGLFGPAWVRKERN